MADPLSRLSQLRIIKLSADIEAMLRADVRGGGVVIEILHRLRERSAESLSALALCNVYTRQGREEFITLQNEVKRYDEFIGCLRDIVSEGVAFDREIEASEREELLDLLTQTPEGEREAIDLGLIDPEAQHE